MLYAMREMATKVGRVALSDGELAVLDAMTDDGRIAVTFANAARVKFGLLNLAQRARVTASFETLPPEDRTAARKAFRALSRAAGQVVRPAPAGEDPKPSEEA